MSTVLLMVGTAKGGFLLRSDEERNNWSITGPLFEGWEVLGFLFDERSAPTLYACLYHRNFGTAIRRSEDLGSTWIDVGCPAYPMGSEQQLHRVWCMAPGASNEPDVLYAGVDEAGLFVTHDRGETFEPVDGLNNHESRPVWFPGHGGLPCHWIHVDPSNGQKLWVAISAAGIFRSDDAGTTWLPKNRGLQVFEALTGRDDVGSCIHSVAVSPQDSSRMYQQNHGGVYRSLDGAETWEPIESGLDGTFGLPIAIDPSNDRRIFASPIVQSDTTRIPIDGKLEVYGSEDGGETWLNRSHGLPKNRYYHFPLRYGLAADGLASCGVYLGTTCGDIFLSRNGGAVWSPLSDLGRLPRVLCLDVAVLDQA